MPGSHLPRSFFLLLEFFAIDFAPGVTFSQNIERRCIPFGSGLAVSRYDDHEPDQRGNDQDLEYPHESAAVIVPAIHIVTSL